MGLIYVDTCLLIYLTESHPQWGARVATAIARAGGHLFCLSPLTKCECLVGPMRSGDMALQMRYEALFKEFSTIDMPESVYLMAAGLRARFGLKTPDALHLACAQHHGCDALWTNDERLTQAGDGLARNILV